MTTQQVAGIDIGTTFAKGVVLAPDGSCLRSIRAPIGRSVGAEGLDADAVVEAIRATADELWPFDALAIVGMINTHLLVDADGEALTQALVWNDDRAREFASARWKSSSAVARTAYWESECREVYERARWLMLPRDYAVLKLSGRACTDPTSWPDMFAGGVLAGDVPHQVLDLLPECLEPGSQVGEYRGVPLVTGCMDSLAAVLGVGPTPVGTAIDIGGTSETIGVVSATEERRSAVRGLLRLPEGWWHAGPTQGGGGALAWAADLLAGGSHRRLVELGVAAERPTGIVFLPYLEGERSPIWDPTARGAFVGIEAHHGPADFAVAVLEGVAFSVRHVLDEASPEGERASEMVISGGPSAVEIWNQVKADVTGLTCFVPAEPETGSRGAAMLARSFAAGRSLADVRAELALPRQEVRPQEAASRRYEDQYQAYLRLWPAIRAATES